jgi:pyrroline-5-carboxylate reductase
MKNSEDSIKLGFIGAGNLVKAITTGHFSIAQEGANKGYGFEAAFYTPNGESAKALANSVGQAYVTELSELADCDILVLGFKPYQLAAVARAWPKEFEGKSIWSLLGATPVATIKQKLNVSSVARIMSNTPTEFRKGISLIYCPDGHLKFSIDRFFGAVGLLHYCDQEFDLDRFTGPAGSAPAILLRMAQAMETSFIQLGLGPELARSFVLQHLDGCRELMSQKDDSVSELIDHICSKKGITVEGIQDLEKAKIDEIVASTFTQMQLKIVQLLESSEKHN